MKYEIKVERAYEKLPTEVLIQYSSGTDNLKVLKENAINEGVECNKTELEILLKYAIEVEETYTCDLLSHFNYELQFEDKKEYNSELREIRKYIKYLNDLMSK